MKLLSIVYQNFHKKKAKTMQQKLNLILIENVKKALTL